MKMIKNVFLKLAIVTALALTRVPAAKGGTDPVAGEAGKGLQALVSESLNPVSGTIKVPFQSNFDFGIGPAHVTRSTLDIGPIIPFRLNEDWNLITRTIIPIVSQPSAGPHEASLDGLGDINPAIFLSPAHSHHQVFGFGPSVTLPTGTSPQLTSGKWSVGPSVVYMTMPGPWMIGAVASHQWSVGGWGDREVSETSIQPIIIYHLPEGWYLVSVPLITADWKAASDNRWTVPVGGGAGKVVKLGKLPLNLQLQAFYNVERPAAHADWQLRFQMMFLFPQ